MMTFRIIAAVVVLLTCCARPAGAQTLTDVLSFLLTNRSIATGNFAVDEQAAAATRDAITKLVAAELATQPFGSPASGFTYRLDPAIGTSVRSSTSFGPFFTERSLTAGRHWAAIGLSYRDASFDNIDGRNLRDGRLVATASRITGESQPFDVESLTLRIHMRTLTLSSVVGLTDRLDLSAAVPFVNLGLEGQRIDTYRGDAFVQATADATASGIGDVVVRGKFNAVRGDTGGLAVVADARFPTGSARNLLGGNELVVIPRLVGSMENGRVGVHGNVGYSMGTPSRDVEFQASVAGAASSRVTVVFELFGRRTGAGGRLLDTIAPHPNLVGVETIRLSASEEPTTKIAVVTGLRWNAAGPWVVSASVLRPVTTTGLNARWMSTISLDYSVGR